MSGENLSPPAIEGYDLQAVAVYRGIGRHINGFVDMDFAPRNKRRVEVGSLGQAKAELHDLASRRPTGLPEALGSMPISSLYFLRTLEEYEQGLDVDPVGFGKKTVGVEPVLTPETAYEASTDAIESLLARVGEERSRRGHRQRELKFDDAHREEFAKLYAGPYKKAFLLDRAMKPQYGAVPLLYNRVTGKELPYLEPKLVPKHVWWESWFGTDSMPAGVYANAFHKHAGHLGEMITKRQMIRDKNMNRLAGIATTHTKTLAPTEFLAQYFEKKGLTSVGEAAKDSTFELQRLLNGRLHMVMNDVYLGIHSGELNAGEATEYIRHWHPLAQPERIPSFVEEVRSNVFFWPYFAMNQTVSAEADRVLANVPETHQSEIVNFVAQGNPTMREVSAKIDSLSQATATQ